jgi:transcription antitermination factor NusG
MNLDHPSEAIKWYAVKVRSRGEEAIANALRVKGYEVLLPTYTVVKRYSDRTIKASCVLFAGYVFVRMNLANMLNLISTDGVNYVVRSASGCLALSDAETRTIEALCSVEKVTDFEPHSYLSVGQRVRIEAGPLTGLEGVLLRVRDMDRIVVNVETLHSAVSIEIGHTRVRVIDVPNALLGSELANNRTRALTSTRDLVPLSR